MKGETDGLVITMSGLRKSYGSFEAVRGIDLQVARGEVFALLGPNGAGKTTMVEILEGYRTRTAGEVRVLGEDPERASSEFRTRIGVVLQASPTDPELKVKETLGLHAGYYPAPLAVSEVLRLVGLDELGGRKAGRLSGGEQRRLDVSLALIGDPELLFLDEPTTGFDPAARHDFWRLIKDLARMEKTVFLTTHYMDEAEALADCVAVLVGGRIVAEGPPDQVGGDRVNTTRISFGMAPELDLSCLPAVVRAAMDVQETAQAEARNAGDGKRMVVLKTSRPMTVLGPLLAWAAERGLELSDLEVHRPRLEEIYLDIVGRNDGDVSTTTACGKRPARSLPPSERR
jgi:ABC-2 type transport system ATP-binding protein